MSKRILIKNKEKGCWSGYTWNPISGCNYGCSYCYARGIANRLYFRIPKEERFEPRLYIERLCAIQNTKIPVITNKSNSVKESLILVGSMGDLFDNGFSDEQIKTVLDTIEKTPGYWNFALLTKFPKRLLDFKIPNSAWVGVTVDRQSKVREAEEVFLKLDAWIKYISCEPLLEQVTFSNLGIFDWIIIGPLNKGRKRYIQPRWEWVYSLINQARKYNLKIFFRPGLELHCGQKMLKEYPIG